MQPALGEVQSPPGSVDSSGLMGNSPESSCTQEKEAPGVGRHLAIVSFE